MAAPTPPPRPARPLAVIALITLAMYAGMFLIQSSWQPTPKLGLDLRGGTSVTLTAQLTGGSGDISSSAMDQAKDIITDRVNGTGVAEAEVAVEGQNIVINLPEGQFDPDLLSTALLRFRPLLQEDFVAPPVEDPTEEPTGDPSAEPSPSEEPNPSEEASATPSDDPSAEPSETDPTDSGRAVSESLLGAQDGTPADDPSAEPTPGAEPTEEPAEEPADEPATPEITPAIQEQFDQLTDCAALAEERRGIIENPDELLVTCDQDGMFKYILGPVAVEGTHITDVQAGLLPNSVTWQVDLTFDGEGTGQFADVTQAVAALTQPQNRIAIVLDGAVVSSPSVNDPQGIPGGIATISGDFSQSEAQDLADVLKYGALPLSFEQSDLQSITPTLGQDTLRGGLIAGIIGLVAVVVYVLFYYRGLGLVAVASLALAGLTTYAAVVLLGEWIGFTLTLAGIAGLIVAIGITVDSFIVFFERIRDEVRGGRSLRAAVEHGWQRAKRTILVADAVALIGAIVLYILAIGNVRGFAFVLGLITVIDLIIVFMFTKPLVTMLARTQFFSSGHRWSGVDPTRMGARRTAPTGQPQSIVARRRAASAEEA